MRIEETCAVSQTLLSLSKTAHRALGLACRDNSCPLPLSQLCMPVHDFE
jgi:hypothetical protein